MKTIATFIGVWFVASLANGFLSGICISIGDSGIFSNPLGAIFLACICSFLFSVPLVGVVWLTAVIAQSTGKSGHALFQVVLAAAFIAGLVGALFFTNTLGNEFKEANYVAGLCFIISATGAVMVFRKRLINED
jgi:sorbitol-specific phosphotransferase system component IIBC